MKITKELQNYIDSAFERKAAQAHEDRKALAISASRELTASPEYKAYMDASKAMLAKTRELCKDKPIGFVGLRDLSQYDPDCVFYADGSPWHNNDLRFERTTLLAKLSCEKDYDAIKSILAESGIEF